MIDVKNSKLFITEKILNSEIKFVDTDLPCNKFCLD